MNTIEKFNENVMATYGRYPLVMESGKDECAIDENGKKFPGKMYDIEYAKYFFEKVLKEEGVKILYNSTV